jgi:hypothetical protein
VSKRRKELTNEQYWWLRDRIEDLFEQFRHSDAVCADAARTIIQAGVAEACVLFPLDTARDFIAKAVNMQLVGALEIERKLEGEEQDRDEQAGSAR